ncbi:MAG: D-alanine--D-alanine ligase [Granulosicoccus sp.]
MHDSSLNGMEIQPYQFGKVAVVMGGWSAEREVSLMSGQNVFEALSRAGVDAHPVDAGRDIATVLSHGGFDRAFLILHGRGGEDGQVQAALELAGIPYTGSGVLGSALCMDKWRAKALVTMRGVATPKASCVANIDEAIAAVKDLGLPVVIKPTNEGSSIGVSVIRTMDELADGFAEARRYGTVLIEQFMSGLEIAATVIGDSALPLVSTKAASGFYDYNAKYIASDTEYVCPAELSATVTDQIQAMALRVFETLGCRTWVRVDFMLDAQGEPQFIECNTIPGMTSHSLVPIAALECGMNIEELCLQILADTLVAEGATQ